MTHWVPVRSRRIACVTSEVRNRSESENLTDEMHSLGQQMSCMRDCIASMFDEQAGLRSKAHAAVQLATTCENTVYRARKSLLGDCTPSCALGCAGNTTARLPPTLVLIKMCDFVQSVPQRPVGPESDAGAEARSGESAATKASHFGADAGAPKGGACARPARREDCFHTHPKAPPVQTRTARPRARTRRTPPMVRCGFALRACGRMDF